MNRNDRAQIAFGNLWGHARFSSYKLEMYIYDVSIYISDVDL